MPTPRVVAVSRDSTHRFSKVPVESITLVAGLGVLGDAHAGTLVQHRSRVRRDPNQPNLRQVHLLHAEVFDDARALGYELGPGLLKAVLSRADGTPTDEAAPSTASPEIATVAVIRKAGVMAVVELGGAVVPGGAITVTLPEAPHLPLAPV